MECSQRRKCEQRNSTGVRDKRMITYATTEARREAYEAICLLQGREIQRNGRGRNKTDLHRFSMCRQGGG